MEAEYVELVNDNSVLIGKAFKSEVHDKDTPLQRAVSCYILILQVMSCYSKEVVARKHGRLYGWIAVADTVLPGRVMRKLFEEVDFRNRVFGKD